MKNVKYIGRLWGGFLMAALFLAFGGGTLRAQDVVYNLVTDASTLRNGDEVLIVNANGEAMAASINQYGETDVVQVAITDNAIINPDIATASTEQKACVFTLEKNSDGDYAFKCNSRPGQYLSESGAMPDYTSIAHYCTIEILDASTGSASVYMHNASGGKYYIRYNSYASFDFNEKATDMGDEANIYLYKKQKNDPTTPFLETDKTEVSYAILPTANLNENLSFTAENLVENVEVEVKSATAGQTSVIRVDPMEIRAADANSPDGFDIALTTSNLPKGTYSDIITLTSGEATVSVRVNLEVKEMVLYQKVTDASTLNAEDVVLIVSVDGYAMTASISEDASTSGTREGVQIEITDNKIIDPTIATKANEKKACEFTLEKDADGKWAFNDNLNTKKYLSSNLIDDYILPSSSTAFYFSVRIDASGVATIESSNKQSRYIRYCSDYSPNTTSNEFFQLVHDDYETSVSLYKKQVPEEPICEAVTLSSESAAMPSDNSVVITWDAPAEAPAEGYEVTVKGPEGYEKLKTATLSEINWDEDLNPETFYSFEIVAVCEADFKSVPVKGTFTTDPSGNPEITITSPAQGTTFPGDVIFAFTTTDFTLDDTHLVKATVKTKAPDSAAQVAAPVLKTVYTNTNSLTISGLADGQYHVDLYMALANGKDTAVVGFNGKDYAHRNVVVKNPAVYFSPNPLKITTYRGVAASGKVQVSGWALPENTSVSFNSSDNKFTITPNTLTQAQVMAGGTEITVTYNGAAATATATITATCGSISATLTVNATAKDTLANLKGLYNRANNDTVLVRGKMVVTHKDTSNNRVWVQDINKENGASMLLYQVTDAKGYNDLKVGDVLENFAGRITVSSENLYRFTPLAKVEATESNHAVYVDTLTADDINTRFAEVQSALACVKNVTFEQKTGNFAKNTKYTLQQGNKNINFVAFNSADYVGKPIPTVRLYVVGVLSANGTYGTYIAARKEADMTEAPCLVPTDFAVEVHSDEATIEWNGWAADYLVRYGKEADLESAEANDVINKKNFTATNLDELTTYYYQVKSLCSATNESEWSEVKSFKTRSASEPSITMLSPVDRPTFTDSVLVLFRLYNATLKAGDITASIAFSDGVTVDDLTDTVYKRAMPSGDYNLQVILKRDGQELEPSVQSTVRYFSVDLPDVAKPVFTPKAGRYKDSVEVTLECTTPGASIFYAKNNGAYVAYTAGSKILLKESATLKAYATKERMDTSAVATAAYTVYSMPTPEGDLVFAENFNKSTKASTTVISNFGEFTDMSGWTGANMYPEVGEIKGGTSSKAGRLVSREIDLSRDNGKYYVAFFARAFNNTQDSTQIRLTAGDETVSVSGLEKTEMIEYVYLFNNGTAHTQLTFEALAAAYNRFYLDSIRVYQKLPEEPMIIAPATLSMSTVPGTPVNQTVTVRGKLLEGDVAVSCPEGNFTVSPATLDKEAVMSEDGAEITVTFNGEVDADGVEITLASGSATATIEVTATAEEPAEITVVPTLAMNTTQGKPVSEKVTVKGKFLKEDVAVSCPEGNFSVSPATLDKEDVMSENGAELTVTFNGEVAADEVEITLASGSATEIIKVTATAGGGDKCDAPTLLSATVVDNSVTLSWNGETETFRVVVRLGDKEVCNSWIPENIYELNDLEAGVYSWAVASICTGGEKWTDGDNFEVKESSANEDAEGLAFRIYPNPTAGAFYVEVAEGARMEIFNVGGVLIRDAELGAGRNEIRLDRSGIYFLRLTNAHGSAVNRVIVR